MPAGAALTVKFYDGETTPSNFIGEQRITRPLAFNTATPVSVPLTIRQGRLRNITAVVEPEGIVPESDLSNNTARAILGRPPSPLQAFGNSDPERRVISLGWTASGTRGIAQYRVFRSQTPGAGYELVGTTVNTDFIDTLVRPGVQYYYVVQTIESCCKCEQQHHAHRGRSEPGGHRRRHSRPSNEVDGIYKQQLVYWQLDYL